ncbi:uncharacterized protein PGTG_02816 [Puccinia graminis f. sp. tritici CRL 75-36-700-3]|uniref:J domain-containing protein n=1 Tax=Puccinia graminis f. sp. tritici (strain CRL 75-36-700-3 / race SCCL) TaxID=418459 RepID=E3JWF0_PUCGT|nr:uncharacterized protein PGTG_02816 [Puccinia graminis f. sp. tritici CRL 75-36-700-3]EFP76375.1 hypothetical protein PGTG_02816 [Puccinia graminis f. sp. tritici CRL 75-36-700-3]
MTDAYRVLNVSPTASLSDIRDAYLDLACLHHPCKLSDRQAINSNLLNSTANHTQFRLAAEAYALIGDDSRRELYDLIKSSEYRKSAGRYAQDAESTLAQERLGGHPIGRSRARSELTIDLRVGLPPELRAMLIDLDPVKVFNQVVCQIDQERRAQRQARQAADKLASSTSSSFKTTSNKPSSMAVPQSKYLSPPSRFLDESSFSRTSNSKSSGVPVRDEGSSTTTTTKQPHFNGALKTGILRDESKSQFRQSPSSIGELLSRDHGKPYQSSIHSEYYREPIRSSGQSTSSSSYISNSASHSGGSSHRNNRSRRVSFSNDVIESDQLKQAREAVKSFKSEAARKTPKPTLINPTSPRSSSIEGNGNNSNLRGLVNKFGSLSTQGGSTSPSSSFKKPNEFFLDKSLYSDLCSPIDSIPQDILIKPIGIDASCRADSHLPSSATNLSGSSHPSIMARKSHHHHHAHHHHHREPEEFNTFLASSAPTGFLSRYRADQDRLPIIHNAPTSSHQQPHYHHHQQQPSLQHDHAFPWSDPNFDNPRSILINHRSRDPN